MNASNTFMEHHRLLISTLSPIHVGCGEDYEPTNYVIDNGLLYGFDTAALAGLLDAKQREDLLKRVQGPDALLKVQAFIHGLREVIPAISTHTVQTCPQLAAKYKERIGQQAQKHGDDRVIAQLIIPRTSYNPYTQQPVLPGTGLKGAIRTAILNAINNGFKEKWGNTKKDAEAFEREKLDGKFETDPMRLIKIGDAQFVEQSGNISNAVIFDCNLKKKRRSDGKEAKGPSVMREVVSGMNFHCFTSDLSLQLIPKEILDTFSETTPRKTIRLVEVVHAVNRFYGKLFVKELEIMKDLDCANMEWLLTVEKLLADLKPAFESHSVMLLRLGRHSSAEGVTVEGIRDIKIKLDGSNFTRKDHATTFWLSGESEKQQKNLIPFGWLLLEIDPQPDSPVSQKIAATLQQYNATAYAQEKKLKEAVQAAKQKQQETAAKRAEQLTQKDREPEILTWESAELRQEKGAGKLLAISKDGKAEGLLKDISLPDEVKKKLDAKKPVKCKVEVRKNGNMLAMVKVLS